MKTYIYLKTHNKTGLKYLGKTNKDPFSYKGSGKYWKRHIKQHGYDVRTEILAECCSEQEVIEKGLFFSNMWDVVKSSDFANLKPEMGDGGSNGPMPEMQRRSLSESKRGSGNGMFGKITVNNGIKNLVIDKTDPIPDGFIKGQIQKKENKVKANRTRENPNVDKIWIMCENESKMISYKDPIPKGWVVGRKVGKRWITNGFQNKFVDVLQEIPEGWKQGRVL